MNKLIDKLTNIIDSKQLSKTIKLVNTIDNIYTESLSFSKNEQFMIKYLYLFGIKNLVSSEIDEMIRKEEQLADAFSDENMKKVEKIISNHKDPRQ